MAIETHVLRASKSRPSCNNVKATGLHGIPECEHTVLHVARYMRTIVHDDVPRPPSDQLLHGLVLTLIPPNHLRLGPQHLLNAVGGAAKGQPQHRRRLRKELVPDR